ncbi:hypothetical protein LCGC14_1622380 [marine sediment metagenome]|uniref:N-acetyltransferase domain-containing protein n=1 Tax=marine sediment metagenome TaxID=412755 RepID=A0A0F9KKN6_9ZZZZ|nr:Mycothiol acetyltransferase [Candidatus Anoxychlamydiales bacterium]
MKENFKIQKVNRNKSEICEEILRSLKEWFQIESAIKNYVNDVKKYPMFIAKINSHIIGFLSLKIHTKYSAEIYVMGIKKDFHKKGIGKKLVHESIKYLQKKDFKYLSVKTLSASKRNKAYAQTRKFYISLGFCPLEEFKTLWDKNNPCLLMIKTIN